MTTLSTTATPASATAHYQAGGIYQEIREAAVRIWNEIPPLMTCLPFPGNEIKATVWVRGNLLGQWNCPYHGQPLVIPVAKGDRVRVLVQRGSEVKDIAFHVDYKHEHVFIESGTPIGTPIPLDKAKGTLRPFPGLGGLRLRHVSGKIYHAWAEPVEGRL
jgi:hypothetical protein